MIYIYWIVSILLNASANIFFKLSATKGFTYMHGYNIISFVRDNLQLFFGVSFFALSTVSYFLTLRSLPVSTVYPVIVGMSFLLTNMIAYYYLHEKIVGPQVVGYICIVIGVAIVFYWGSR
jgi:multidrug transporter EmrE-like cation transporter